MRYAATLCLLCSESCFLVYYVEETETVVSCFV